MTFSNIWLLFFLIPLVLLAMAEIYGSAKDDIFPSAEARIKDHNYNRINYNNHKWKLFLFIQLFFYLSVELCGLSRVVNLQTILKTWVCCYFLNLVNGFL